MKVIVNADDYGLNENVNSAIIDAISLGMVTDTSILATVEEGFSLAVTQERLKILKYSAGVHLTLTVGKPLTEEMRKDPSFCDADGYFLDHLPYKVHLSKTQRRNIELEFLAQIHKIKDAGLFISHLDSHQHIHYRPTLYSIIIKCCKAENIRFIRRPKTFSSTFKDSVYSFFLCTIYGFNGLRFTDYFIDYRWIPSLPKDNNKTVEVMCHPVYNSKLLIVDKIKKNTIDECELLENHIIRANELWNMCNYSDLV